jgi:hypothetical protein
MVPRCFRLGLHDDLPKTGVPQPITEGAIGLEPPITSQGLGVWVILGQGLFHQTQRLSGISPGMEAGVGQPAKPEPALSLPKGLILEAQGPVRMVSCHGNQPIPGPFFGHMLGRGW